MGAQTSEAVRREIRELGLLFEMAQLLNRNRSLDDVADPLLRMMAEDMDMMRGTITILNRETGELTIEAAYGLSPEERSRGRYRLGEGVTGLVVQTGRPAVVPRVSEEPLFLDRTGTRRQDREQGHNDLSFICVPIRLTQDTIGALSVDRVYSDDTAYPEDVRLLTIMASLIAYPAHLRQAGLERRRAQEERNARFRGGESGSPPAAGIDGRVSHPGPDPARELESLIEREVLPSADSAVHTGRPLLAAQTSEANGLEARLNAVEQEMLFDSLMASHGNMAAAARRLGLTERMMGLRVHKHGIDLKQFKRLDPESSCLP